MKAMVVFIVYKLSFPMVIEWDNEIGDLTNGSCGWGFTMNPWD